MTTATINIQQVIQEARDKVARERHERKEQERLCNIQHAKKKHYFETALLPSLRLATKEDYTAFLKRHILRGGKISHFYDYCKFEPSRDFYVAESTVHLEALYGANAVSIIVPEGIRIEMDSDEGLGHNQLYFMDDSQELTGYAPIWLDTIPE